MYICARKKGSEPPVETLELDCGDLRSYAQFGFGSHFIVTKKREDCEHIHHRYLAILLLCPAFWWLVLVILSQTKHPQLHHNRQQNRQMCNCLFVGDPEAVVGVILGHRLCVETTLAPVLMMVMIVRINMIRTLLTWWWTLVTQPAYLPQNWYWQDSAG